MTTTITVTGSGMPTPSATRAGPGLLVQTENCAVQIDAGRSTVQRLVGCGLPLAELDAVFLTHHHSDHLTGLQDLVLTRWTTDRSGSLAPLQVISPAGPTSNFVDHMLDIWSDDISARVKNSGKPAPSVNSQAFTASKELQTVWEKDDMTIQAGMVDHGDIKPAVGYRIETTDGVIAVTGDTSVCDEVANLAKEADVLVYEAIRPSAVEQHYPKSVHYILDYHAHTDLIGAQAEALGIPQLILTHLVPEPKTALEKQGFIDDVRAGGYTGELLLADDLDSITLS